MENYRHHCYKPVYQSTLFSSNTLFFITQQIRQWFFVLSKILVQNAIIPSDSHKLHCQTSKKFTNSLFIANERFKARCYSQCYVLITIFWQTFEIEFKQNMGFTQLLVIIFVLHGGYHIHCLTTSWWIFAGSLNSQLIHLFWLLKDFLRGSRGNQDFM